MVALITIVHCIQLYNVRVHTCIKLRQSCKCSTCISIHVYIHVHNIHHVSILVQSILLHTCILHVLLVQRRDWPRPHEGSSSHYLMLYSHSCWLASAKPWASNLGCDSTRVSDRSITSSFLRGLPLPHYR